MIYILEDDDNIRKLVSYALKKEGYDVLGFPEPGVFWEAMRNRIPELIMLDIMLPVEDGLSILKKIRNTSAYEDIPVIMLTAKSSEFDKASGLDLGADDYISKPFGIMELTSRVRAVLRRVNRGNSVGVSRETYKIGCLEVDNGKHSVTVNGESVDLSFKEYSLLLCLLEADQNVVSREELLNHVWGEYYGESRTLDVHISKLRVKLGEAGDYIRTVKGVGYKENISDDISHSALCPFVQSCDVGDDSVPLL